jgi:hypothetical protein
MVIHDFNIGGLAALPHEANTIAVIDRMLHWPDATHAVWLMQPIIEGTFLHCRLATAGSTMSC